MASTLQEMVYNRDKLSEKLQRLLNLQSMMTKEDAQLNNDIRLTRMRLDDIRRKIDEHPHR